MIKDISLLLNNTAQGVPQFQGRAGVIERLQRTIEQRADNTELRQRASGSDGVEVHISQRKTKRRLAQSNAGQILYNRLKEVRSGSEADHSAFVEGQNFKGLYNNGQFITNTGFKGSYGVLTSGGHIGFRLDGYHGMLMPNGKAVAMNPDTGEAFSMHVEYGEGKYQVTNVQELQLEQFQPGDGMPILTEGDDNFAVTYDKNGMIQMKMRLTEGLAVEGKGFMDKKGNLIVGLSDGSTFEGHYAFSDAGKLQIYE